MLCVTCTANGRSTQCFSIEDEGSASEASSRRAGGPRGEQAMDAPASLIIDPMNILGEEGGRFKRCVGFFEPPKRKGGWRATRKKRCVTCRPHRSLKDSVLCLRSCLAPAQNINFCLPSHGMRGSERPAKHLSRCQSPISPLNHAPKPCP